jgi:periplasmic protein TonB
MLSLLIAVLLQAAPPATPAPAPPPPVIANPDWISQPSPEEIAKVYPGAGGLVSPGSATLSCKVTAEGALAGCQVISEQPGYVGFSSAALKLSGKFRMKPTTADGKSVAGGVVQVPIQFPGR